MDDDENQLSEWRAKQRCIASKVVVQKCAAPKCYNCNAASRFHSYAPHLKDFIKSFNEKNKSILVGGVDVSFPTDESEESIAVYAILEFKFNSIDKDDDREKIPTTAADVQSRVVYRSHKFFFPDVPYIPSYLAFRETNPLCELISSQIDTQPLLKPDVIMVDGNGRWHERRAGIACFVGVKTGIPTIGVGKTFYSLNGCLRKEQVLNLINSSVKRWYAEHVTNASPFEMGRDGVCAGGGTASTQRGLIIDSNPISCNQDEDESVLPTRFVSSQAATMQDEGETLAYALVGHGGNESKNNESGTKNPIYVSVGSHISAEDAVALCALLSYVRIPEPVREADLYGRQVLRDKGKK